MSHTDLWGNALSQLKKELSGQVFNAWFLPIKPLSFDQKKLILEAPNTFFKDWFNERYFTLLTSLLTRELGSPVEIEFTVASEAVASKEQDKARTKKPGWLRAVFPKHDEESLSRSVGINPKYTFDDFVIGPSNRFAHAASFAVAESPAKAYNPLFIYGGVGLGKTHLMNAIGNAILKADPKARMLYISSEEFTNQLIGAIQTRTTSKFRERYRHLDLLLIDDIHFIGGKEATQEEFFHTFNALHDAHKQIVISSDRPPKEIPTLEERLVSRFEWGLITDIQAPDFETRIAILKKKSEKETIHLPDELFFFLAENIKTNVRELEGALIRVVAYAKLMNKNVGVDLAKEVLKGMIVEGERKIGVGFIQERVAKYFSLKLQDMKIKKRTKAVVYPRQIAMYLSRGLTDLSLPEIGVLFGGRDHTTVIHACEKIERDMKQDEKVRFLVEKILSTIKK
ncbi:MAG: chromosomal replication initiator protein DnaA [Candidatus Omnitrophica bacterium]|nr:chromosomal replication initiator protein DnaA [Candidatus Omnitrophota bacterium]